MLTLLHSVASDSSSKLESYRMATLIGSTVRLFVHPTVVAVAVFGIANISTGGGGDMI